MSRSVPPGWGWREWRPEPARPKASVSQPEEVLEALADGPGTSTELAEELGVTMRHCSAVLSRMHREGRIDRKTWPRGYVYMELNV